MTGTLEDILTMRQSGYTLREIGAQCGCSRQWIGQLLEQHRQATYTNPAKIEPAPFDDHLPKDNDLLQELMDEVAALSCRLTDMTGPEIIAQRNEFKAERAAVMKRVRQGENLSASVHVYCTLISMCSHELEARDLTW